MTMGTAPIKSSSFINVCNCGGFFVFWGAFQTNQMELMYLVFIAVVVGLRLMCDVICSSANQIFPIIC